MNAIMRVKCASDNTTVLIGAVKIYDISAIERLINGEDHELIVQFDFIDANNPLDDLAGRVEACG